MALTSYEQRLIRAIVNNCYYGPIINHRFLGPPIWQICYNRDNLPSHFRNVNCESKDGYSDIIEIYKVDYVLSKKAYEYYDVNEPIYFTPNFKIRDKHGIIIGIYWEGFIYNVDDVYSFLQFNDYSDDSYSD